MLNPEEFYLSVIVPHLSLQPCNKDAFGISLTLDLGTMLLGHIREHRKSSLDLTLSLVSAAEILNSSRVLWQNNSEKVTVRQKLSSFVNELAQFEKGEQTFCGMIHIVHCATLIGMLLTSIYLMPACAFPNL